MGMRHVGCILHTSLAAWTLCMRLLCTCSLRSWQQVCWSHPTRPSWSRMRRATSSMSWRTFGISRTAALSRFTAKNPSTLPTLLLHTWLTETWGWGEGRWGSEEMKRATGLFLKKNAVWSPASLIFDNWRVNENCYNTHKKQQCTSLAK